METGFDPLLLPGCRLCPRQCGVDRAAGERGYCQAGARPVVSQAGPHHGEEPPLSGRLGSGTIFFCGCNLHCVFCQNQDISVAATGPGESPETLAETMLFLETSGCHNINFVTPSHHADQVAGAIRLARKQGLAVPVVYNCGGYESEETLRLLDGLVDIYMPDVKFFDAAAAARYLDAPDYPRVAQNALRVMQDQVGDLELEGGLARRGLLIRHLLMPGFREDALAVVAFIRERISSNAYLNIMGQYWPTSEVSAFPELRRGIDFHDLEAVKDRARQLGLRLCP